MPATLSRKLNLWATISIVAGSIIGSSIFMKPAVMAGQLGSPLLLLFVWIFAGAISMMGAAINAEIGTMLPATGGQYVFFQKMYGNFFAYLYGWASFAVINTASVAAIAYIFSQYATYFFVLPRFSVEIEQAWHISIPFLGKLFPLENFGIKTLTMLVILLLTWINTRSVKAGGAVQIFFSAVKVIALLFMIGLIFFSGKGSTNNFTQNSVTGGLHGWGYIAGIVAALSGALGAYDGWNNIGFVAGEINNPKKNIPKGLFIGLGLCIILYVLTSQAYLYMLPIDSMAKSALVATDSVTPIIGNTGAGFIALLVMVSTFGAVNGNILACARVTFAMAKEGVFFKQIGNVHTKHKTPANALWLHAIWACLFVITGSFDMLIDLFVFITWIFYGFAAAGVFILRKKMPKAERPYKTWGYPITPIIFVAFSALYFILTLYADIDNYVTGKTHFISSVFGLVLTVAGVPFYFYFKKKKKKEF
jgi:APA family basic amino acid/polyamine antiporter